MKINQKEYVFFDIKSQTKNDVLKEISKRALQLNLTTDEGTLYQAFLKREDESSTGFEDGFAIPHARTKSITKPALLFANLEQPVDWTSIDGKLTKYLFVILVPEGNKDNAHIEILSKISIMLMDKNFVEKIKSLSSSEEVSDLITSTIEKKINEDKDYQADTTSNKKIVLGLTACPVGVAHTYLAAEKLTEAGKKWVMK